MFAVIAAEPEELEAVAVRMENRRRETVYGLSVELGSLRGVPCAAALSGVGKVAAARTAQLLIDRFAPEAVLNVGSAGALNPDLTFGDIVIGRRCCQSDFDLTALGRVRGEHPDFGLYLEADAALVARLVRAAEQLAARTPLRCVTGTIATADNFENDPVKKRACAEAFSADCDEMEGAAVGQVCTACGVPFAVVRSISDHPTDASVVDFETYLPLASERCAQLLELFFAELSASRPNQTEVSHMKEYPVASFNIDHRTMTAPKVTLMSKIDVGGSTLYKYDIRLCKPNSWYIDPAAMHALEHIACLELRARLNGVWDLSPMGCMTGMYLSIFDEADPERVAAAFRACLEKAIEADSVPAATEIECGNYRFMNLPLLKETAARILRDWNT